MQHVIDRVLEISNNLVLLQSERDKKIFQRIKSDPCLS